jgi:hypothetical protein
MFLKFFCSFRTSDIFRSNIFDFRWFFLNFRKYDGFAVHEFSFPTQLCNTGSNSCRLKRLHLSGISLHKTFTLHLRSGCPVLEDLVLERCFVAYPEIMASTLKTLVIIDSRTYWGNTLTAMAPALVSLHLDIIAVGGCWNGVLVDELPSLVKATFCFRYHTCPGRSAKKGPWKLLSGLTNVSDLRLSGEDTLVSFLLLLVFHVTLCIILIVLMIDMHSLTWVYVCMYSVEIY